MGTRWNWTCVSRPGGYIGPSDMIRGSRLGVARLGETASMLPKYPIMCLAPPPHIILHHPNSPPPDLYVDGILLESPCTFVLYNQQSLQETLGHLTGLMAGRRSECSNAREKRYQPLQVQYRGGRVMYCARRVSIERPCIVWHDWRVFRAGL
jgi:hypothetical protein